MSYKTITINDVINHIKKKQYLLPSIQREFVWKTNQIELLFDSLMRDYPIGTFLFWHVDKGKIDDFEFYEFLTKYHEKESRHNLKATPSKEESITAILDGQQRMTSLYLALCGSYSVRKVGGRKDNPDSYQEKYLYLNLLKKSDDIEREYDFKFLTLDEAQSSEGFWFQCQKIISLNDAGKAMEFLMEHSLTDTSKCTQEEASFAYKTIVKFCNVIHDIETINFFEEKDEKLDKVLQIFIRINSGGTPLRYSDLLLSIATAQWKQGDAREVIHEFVDTINDIGDGFDFNKDLILKSCLVLSDIPSIRFKADNFTKSNMAKIEKCWDKIANSLEKSVRLISSFGYNKDNLRANNAIIPIAYFIYKNNFENTILSNSSRDKDRKLIREWLARVLAKGVFGGQPDSVYPIMRKIIEDNEGRFPLQEIIERFKTGNKSILFNDDEIEALLDLKYNDKKAFYVLALLYPSVNYSFKHHRDHIHPKSLFKNKESLVSLGMNLDDANESMKRIDELANLQLLEAHQNFEKNDQPFETWLHSKWNKEQERNTYLMNNYIDNETNLSLKHFIPFMNERRAKLKKELIRILGKQTDVS